MLTSQGYNTQCLLQQPGTQLAFEITMNVRDDEKKEGKGKRKRKGEQYFLSFRKSMRSQNT